MESARTHVEDTVEKGQVIHAATREPLPHDQARLVAVPDTTKTGGQRITGKKGSDERLPPPLEKWVKGYPSLAALVNSDENFMLYRRFGYLQSRILLSKQEELRRLEQKLSLMDFKDSLRKPSALQQHDPDDSKREDLLYELGERFKEYAQLLIIARDLAAFNAPPESDYTSVKNYFDNEGPIMRDEMYIYDKEDIVMLKPGREHSWLDEFVGNMLQRFFCRTIQYIFATPEVRRKTDPTISGVKLLSRERINILVALLLTATILALLITPIYILYHLTRGAHANKTATATIMILLVFTLLFSGVLSLFTRAKRHEILSAAAAYCAVLVVFIGNLGQISNN